MSKCTESDKSKTRPQGPSWIRPSLEEKIFRIPEASLIMYTTQKAGSTRIAFYFLTNFAQRVVISLDVALYAFAAETAQHYLSAIRDASTSAPVEPVTLPKSSVAMAKYRPSDPRIFDRKKFQLEPTLNVLGDYTPKVETVLGWMKITHADKTIPAFAHMLLADNLEHALRALDSFAQLLAKGNAEEDERMLVD